MAFPRNSCSISPKIGIQRPDAMPSSHFPKAQHLIDSILLSHLQDTDHVLILLGDDGDHETVGDFSIML